MARILVVDDRPINRQFLAQLLGYAGHEIVEASDGIEALEITLAERPDLIIVDLLMPRMDGYEFVRQVRSRPEIAGSRIVFYTATYRKKEAQTLAEATGVEHVIAKPTEPEEVLRIVAEALRSGAVAPGGIDDSYRATHVQLLTDTLIEKSVELETANVKLAALVELALDLAAERDADRILDRFTAIARKVIPSRWCVTALFGGSEQRVAWFHADGFDDTAFLESILEPRRGILGMMLARKQPSRSAGLAGDPTSLGFSAQHPPVHSFLGVPLLSGAQELGWFYLVDREGEPEFSAADEMAARTLASLLSVTFVNLRLTADVRSHAVRLEREAAERRRAEAESLELARQNRLLLDAAAEGIYGLDRSGAVTFINPAAARMLGYRPDELTGIPVHDLIHHTRPDGSKYPLEECRIYAAFQDGESHATDAEIFWRKDGSSFPVEYKSVPIRGEGGEVLGAVVTFSDITERLRRQEELERERRISGLGRVAATIGHEFNNVLMAISPFVEVLKRKAGEPERVRKAAETIGNAVNRGKNITRDILRFTTPEEPRLEPVDVAAWLRDLEPELMNLAGAGVSVTVDCRADSARVAADAHQLAQVITNLAANARDAMDGKGTLTIECEAGGETCVIRVRDSGCGIRPEIAERIFEPLFTTKRSGTGLGLAVTQHVIRSHCGTIRVESRPGAGAMFVIELPLWEESCEQPRTDVS